MDAEPNAAQLASSLLSQGFCQYPCAPRYTDCDCRKRIAAALRQARAEAIEECKLAALRSAYGPQSSWGAPNPTGWHLGRPCTPTDASMHDNGTIDAARAIVALLAAPAPEADPIGTENHLDSPSNTSHMAGVQPDQGAPRHARPVLHPAADHQRRPRRGADVAQDDGI